MTPEELADGCCWLGPHPAQRQLHHVGVAVTAGTHLPLFSCAPCLQDLLRQVRAGQGGRCWLWCGRLRTTTLTIGTLEAAGLHTDIHACPQCVWLVETAVVLAALRKDGSLSRPGARRYEPLVPSGRRPRAA
ncbi:hypothetical protein [Streptomyces luteireticuli]|uniref:hypothetical protein n=1 Tax=Streptomyces luteireticuli TaxID=173858 RepID=UPI00355843E0